MTNLSIQLKFLFLMKRGGTVSAQIKSSRAQKWTNKLQTNKILSEKSNWEHILLQLKSSAWQHQHYSSRPKSEDVFSRRKYQPNILLH